MEVGLNEAFGVSPNRGGDYLEEVAVTAERSGFDSLFVPEHIVFFDHYTSRYPYNEDGTLAVGADPGLFDPFAALAVAGRATSTLLLGTAVLLIGERNPLITAREVATVDQLSGGRFLLGVGVGWSREEYEALGVPWEERGRRCDEYIEAMRVLWTAERASYQGRFCTFADVIAYPKPVQSPHPPVLVGGNTAPALRRAARLGDGWFGWNVGPEALATTVSELRAAVDAAGRTDPFVVQVGLQTADLGEVTAYADACRRCGVDRLVLATPLRRRELGPQLERVAAAAGAR